MLLQALCSSWPGTCTYLSFSPCTSGDWHVGIKAAYELFPNLLKQRIKEERRKKWAEKQRGAVTEAVAALAKVRLLWARQVYEAGDKHESGPMGAGAGYACHWGSRSATWVTWVAKGSRFVGQLPAGGFEHTPGGWKPPHLLQYMPGIGWQHGTNSGCTNNIALKSALESARLQVNGMCPVHPD